MIGMLIPEDAIKKIFYDAGSFGPLLLIVLLWLANFFAPLSGSPFLFAGFYLYGRQVVLYATVAAILASITNFLVAKKWGRPLVVRLVGEDALIRLDGLTKNYGLVTLFIFRVFLKEFHDIDIVSYAFGLTGLKFWQYFAVSTLGMVPPTLMWYLLSGKVHNATTFTLFSWIMLYIPLVTFIVYTKVAKNKKG